MPSRELIWLSTDVSDSHSDLSHTDRPADPDGVFALRPRPAPPIVNLVDPVAAIFAPKAP